MFVDNMEYCGCIIILHLQFYYTLHYSTYDILASVPGLYYHTWSMEVLILPPCMEVVSVLGIHVIRPYGINGPWAEIRH